MNQRYIDNLTQEQRATWGIQIFIRLWLSGMCRSQVSQKWTLSEIAVVFEVTQAYLFANEPHTQISLAQELGLAKQTVSRNVRRLVRLGVLRQEEAPDDARSKRLIPVDYFFARDAMATIAKRFGRDWFHGWEQLDKAKGADWYVSMAGCRDKTAKTEIERLRALALG